MSKASSGAMEMMPVFAVSGMVQFLTEAGENGWTVLGTVGSERTREKGREVAGEKEEEGERRVKMEKEGEERRLKEKEKEVVDCYHYNMEGPTVVVLGEAALYTIVNWLYSLRGNVKYLENIYEFPLLIAYIFNSLFI